MLYMMLFGRIGTVRYESYIEYIISHISLVPTRFIFDYIGSTEALGIYNFHLRNIIGNTALFVPLGIFLPCVFPKLRKYEKFLLAVIIIISVIELLQLFLTLGSLDIDDLLLNCLGASAGFGITYFLKKHMKKL